MTGWKREWKPTCAVVSAAATRSHISRTVAKSVASGFSHSSGLPASSVVAHEIEVRRGGRGDDDGLHVGIVDHGVGVGPDPFERADALRALHGVA